MCNKNSPHPSNSDADHQTDSSFMSISMTTKKETVDSAITHKPQPRRKNRTKTRKPKFLSLRLQLSSKHDDITVMTHHQHQQNQFDLFPLHPTEDRDMHDEHNVALLFSSDAGATLNGLLEGDPTTTNTTTTGVTTTSEEDSYSPPSMVCSTFQYDVEENAASSLVRKAMRRRNKERETREERWVCYSEVVEKKEMSMMMTTTTTTEEVSSSTATVSTTAFGSLSLKLNYEGILNAWSDKGPLYVAGEAPQIVPDLADDVLPNYVPYVLWDGWGSGSTSSGAGGNVWKVPENGSSEGNKMKVKEEMGWKLGHREASVLRYKEKRRSRLFSKRIRYEVRKLNAEKRPRMKGRFVKRD